MGCRVGVLVGTGLMAATLLAAPAAAQQEWAREMFETTSHDFGTVGRGAKSQFVFTFKNLYEEEVHIARVKSSCGCTQPEVPQDTISSLETGSIIANFNTLSFTGKKAATMTVVFDRPYYAEVQLQVSGYIRTDVVFDPPAVEFGAVPAGTPKEVTVDVTYAGRDDWTVRDVRSQSSRVEVSLGEPKRGGGSVRYEMRVRLKEDASPGELREPLVLVTDDRNLSAVTLAVSGRVLPDLEVSPASINLGVLRPGETIKKRLVLRASQPFMVLSSESEDDRLTVSADSAEKKLHFLYLQFEAGEEAGKLLETVRIKTDLKGGREVQCVVTGRVEA